MSEKIYIGVAWPYSYAAFHVGNLYGSHYPADIFARFHRLAGNDVVMVSGSDCHGTPITLKAEEEGIAPQELAEKFHAINTELLHDLKIDYSLFTKTSTENHRDVVQTMFLELLARGFIIKETSRQLYSAKEEKYLQDRYVEGTCPYCQSPGARGDQCEKCGRVLDALELIEPRSKVSGDVLEVRETENYFLDLAALQPDLEKFLASKEGVWRPWILAETRGWFREGLRPRAITRDMEYGVPLPIDRIQEKDRVKDIEKKVFYVWFEAVIGYLSATVEWAKNSGNPETWKQFWDKSFDAKQYYFVGEDNLVFHTINWPAQLLGTGKDYVLPTDVFVNKFLLLEGDKISKSKNWIIDTRYLLDTYPLDSIRFYLAYIMTGDDQTNFLWEDFFHVNNGVFLAKIGNLMYRVMTFSLKNFGTEFLVETAINLEQEVLDRIEEAFEKTKQAYSSGKVREAVLEICSLAEFGNEYLTSYEFWKLVKTDEAAAKQVVGNAVAILDALRVLLAPVTPDLAEKLHKDLGYTNSLEEDQKTWQPKGSVPSWTLPSEILPYVTKFEDSMVAMEKEKLG
ncbi:methionine--tRNA ligase [Candidatus Gracilibacteria bacterium CG17_big_fil_post_rev_8_21_14_2_50_48_13]|nr:MAG: methionine--tRNA ligase [Candidatus Gracilibacteria bacterium CG17_big_fil_post_rev_8_21_14_2_50_48_13]